MDESGMSGWVRTTWETCQTINLRLFSGSNLKSTHWAQTLSSGGCLDYDSGLGSDAWRPGCLLFERPGFRYTETGMLIHCPVLRVSKSVRTFVT